MSFWPVLCIVVIAVEGFIGFSVNTLALIYLFDGRLQTKATYKVALVVSTMHFIGLSVISGLTTMCHLFHNQTMFLVYFGLLPLLPQIASDVTLVILVVLVFGLWELTPAPCILQYLALCTPHHSTSKRLLIAYSVSLVLVGWTVQYCAVFFASTEYRAECAQLARHVYHVNADEGVEVHCATLAFADVNALLSLKWVFICTHSLARAIEQNEVSHSLMPIALFGVLPSYSIAYVIFGICCLKIYRALNTYNTDAKSLKTLQLQKRFFKTLLLQGLLPLLVLSLPVCVFFVGVVSGFDMDRLTLSLTFSIWAMPTVQGLVSLSFLRKMRPPTVESISSRNTESRMQ